MIKVVPKVWGQEFWLVNNEFYCLKKMIAKPKCLSSLHYHMEKDETWIVQKGVLKVEVGGVTHLLEPASMPLRVPKWSIHRFGAYGNEECEFLEVSTHHDDEDVVRLEESCGRS